MDNWLAVTALLMVSAAHAAHAADRPAPTVLPHTGPWTVAAEDNLCLLSHGFGTTDAKVTLAFQPLLTASMMELIVLAPDRTADQRTGEATVTLQPGDRTLHATYVSVPTRDHARRLTRMTISSEVMADLAAARTLTVEADRLAMTFQLAPPAKALLAIDACQRDLLTEWGVDPALVDGAHRPVARDPSRSFNADSYPPAAVREGVSGRVVAVLQVDARGTVSNCRVVASAGEALNATTCSIARKIPFIPAHDDAGRAVPSIYVLPVRWVMPG